MEDLIKDFIPYNEALELKNLGFNKSCLGYHYTLNGKDWKFAEKSEYYRLDDEINIGGKFSLLAPTFSQAFRWFRDLHDTHHSITKLPQGALDAAARNNRLLKKYAWYISKDDLNPSTPSYGSGKCDEYEKAELVCLQKMIEIVKEIKNGTIKSIN